MSVFRTVPGPLAASLGLLVPLLCACRASQGQSEEQIVSAVRHGRYTEAMEKARALREANPGDARARALEIDTQVAYLLDQGREEVFRGDLTRGLEIFERAQALAPGQATVASWIAKTRAQLADHWLDVAADSTGPEHLDDAESAYEKVLLYDGGNADARRGLAHVLLLKNYRGGMSKTYFDDGLTSFRQLELEQARRAFQVSQHYKENEPATLRGAQAEQMMAEERLTQAQGLEAAGLYFAARNEYRLVLLIDTDNEEARNGLDRMDREVRATRTMAEADMAIRRGALEKAQSTLAQAEILTEAQKDDVLLLKNGIEERKLEELYQNARSLGEDYRYPEAVQAYDELLALAPDYKDAQLRKATLEEFIHLTEEFYAKALAAPDDSVAEEYLRAIHPVIWPEYKDVIERLQAIEARKAAAQAAESELRAESEKPLEESVPEATEEPKSEDGEDQG